MTGVGATAAVVARRAPCGPALRVRTFGRLATIALAIGVLGIAAGMLCAGGVAAAAAAPSPASGLKPLAPAFKVRSVTGQTLKLDELRAHGPVLVDFWATWCKPCVAAIPELQSLHKDLGPRGLTVVGISVDGPRNFAKVRPFVTRLGITYPVALDEDGTLQEKYQVRAMPTTVLIDRDGTIVRVVQGYRPGEGKTLRAAIEALLPAPSDSKNARSDSAAADTSAGAR